MVVLRFLLSEHFASGSNLANMILFRKKKQCSFEPIALMLDTQTRFRLNKVRLGKIRLAKLELEAKCSLSRNRRTAFTNILLYVHRTTPLHLLKMVNITTHTAHSLNTGGFFAGPCTIEFIICLYNSKVMNFIGNL